MNSENFHKHAQCFEEHTVKCNSGIDVPIKGIKIELKEPERKNSFWHSFNSVSCLIGVVMGWISMFLAIAILQS
jgi:hypothetical protein